ncbi:hypothetical protein PQX77_007527 [Marasmius sp. AFHP31]|nr:hypothetical protein PQX77_007527 [Marasmius sp. AFHP31]
MKALEVSLLILGIINHIPYSVAQSQQTLAQDALSDILGRGTPILGSDAGCGQDSPTCDWMAKVPDETQIVHMNLPGTHDAATWNYSQATQDSLIRYTGSDIPPAEVFRCQEHSLFDMLNGGIRVFDLRYSWNPGNDTVGFYHGAALLAPTTRGPRRQNTAELQEHIYNLFESPLAKRYWMQTNGRLGTLGESRGKLILLQRFAYSLLPTDLTNRIGIALPPDLWTDNGPNIELVYNEDEDRIAYIEDFYEPHPPTNESPDNRAEINILWKFNATIAHLERAGDSSNETTKDQLFITFASAENNDENVFPKIMALGNGTSTTGVNQRLLEWLGEKRGQRRGVVMLDFFDTVPGLVEAVIGL